MLKKISLLLLVIYAAFLAYQLYIHSHATPSLYVVLTFLWGVGPLLLLYWQVCKFSQRYAKHSALIVQAVLTTLGLYVFCDAIYINPDPQSPLGFIFIPLYQYMIVIPVALVFLALHFLVHRKRKN